MIDPKAFYRKLDHLLAQISLETDDASFLPDILVAFEESFGSEFFMGNGRLLEERDDRFVQIAGADSASEEMASHSDFVLRVLDHGSYIFDSDPSRGVIPAAFSVQRTPSRRWMFVYELAQGWSREEISFAMNSVRFALNHRLQAEHVRSDLEQAAEIQQSLLPARPPTFEGYQFAARSVPAEDVGGDFYDFMEMDDGVLGLAIGDASGHGLPAALLVRDVMTGLRMGLEGRFKMLRTLKKLNSVVHRSNWSSRFVSVFYGEIEHNGNFLYANAGHFSPLLIDDAGVNTLEPTGMIFGPLPNAPLERAYAHIAPGAVLVLATDGLAERFDSKNEMFGSEGIAEVVADLRKSDPKTILEAVFEGSSNFGTSPTFDDDASLVIVKRD